MHYMNAGMLELASQTEEHTGVYSPLQKCSLGAEHNLETNMENAFQYSHSHMELY